MKTLIAALSLFVATNYVYASANESCGLKGSIEERIKDCGISNEGFQLVMRTYYSYPWDYKFREVYREIDSGLLWDDTLPPIGGLNHYNAHLRCQSDPILMDGVQASDWRLPTKDEFQAGQASGLRQALPNLVGKKGFWTATLSGKSRAYIYVPSQDYITSSHRADTDISVRCVLLP